MGDMDIDVSKTQNRQNYAPDILAVSVGGGFGTVTMGHHAMAACAMLPRPIAFVPGGVNATWHSLFMGVGTIIVTHSEVNYCGTPTGISYSTPSMGGLAAMVSYAPNMDADQTGSLANASRDGEDYLNAAVTFGSDMGGMSVNVGAAFQTAADDYVDSVTIAASAGMAARPSGSPGTTTVTTRTVSTEAARRMDRWREVLARRHHTGHHLQQPGMRLLRRQSGGNRSGHRCELRYRRRAQRVRRVPRHGDNGERRFRRRDDPDVRRHPRLLT